MKKETIITATVFVIAAGLIITGIMMNQQTDVLRKAINICLECVGIG